MKIGILKETTLNENRVSITPAVAGSLKKLGLEVIVEEKAGVLANFSDDQYKAEGVEVASKSVVMSCDLLIKINPFSQDESEKLKPNQIVLANLKSFLNKDKIATLAKKGVEAHGLELIPRISRAQSMDILSSQSNLSGYMSVIQGAYHSNLVFPLMMTAAGTVAPAKVFIIGVGVAGLQAIATARRMGCVVSAYDVRPETKEQVESLGAKFISVANTEQNQGPSVYAKEMSAEYKAKEREMLLAHVAKQDVIITTALIMGKKSPILIDEEMLSKLRPNTVIVDLAAENGGNTVGAEFDKIVEKNGVKIIGTNMINFVSQQASQLFAKNVYNFLTPHINKETKTINFNKEDDIIKGTLVTKDGVIVNELLKN
jgi:NAD(P) transhydrogenase subunit alpha